MTTFVLVPGAGGDTLFWHRLVAELEGRGHRALPVGLPVRDDSAGLEAYADTVVAVIGDGFAGADQRLAPALFGDVADEDGAEELAVADDQLAVEAEAGIRHHHRLGMFGRFDLPGREDRQARDLEAGGQRGAEIGGVFADEVAGPLGLETWIGTPPEELGRAAYVHRSRTDHLPGFVRKPYEASTLVARDPATLTGLAFLGSGDSSALEQLESLFNNPAVLGAEFPAGGATSTARALARLWAVSAGGGGGE